MNRHEQEMYKDIAKLAKALEKLVKVMEKIIKAQGYEQNDRRINKKNKPME